MFGVAYEGIRKLKAGTAFRAPEHALNNGIVIFEIRHFFNVSGEAASQQGT